MEGIGLGSKGCVSLIAPNYPPSGPLSGYPSSTQAEGLDPVQSIINGEVDTHGSTEGRTGQVKEVGMKMACRGGECLVWSVGLDPSNP